MLDFNNNVQMKLNDFDSEKMERMNAIQTEFKEWIKDKNNLDVSELYYLTNESFFKSLIVECLMNKGYKKIKYPYNCSLNFITKLLSHSDYLAIAYFIKYKFNAYLNDFKTQIYNFEILENYNIDKQMIYRLNINHLLFVNELEFRKLI